jgi:hypothetical protein
MLTRLKIKNNNKPNYIMKPIFITEEIWKNLEKFEGYQVSNLGNIRSVDRYRKGKNNTLAKIKGRSLTIRKNKRGYLECRIKNIDKVIHRLVAQTFILNPKFKPQVNHINGIKTDNRSENLEWCTNSENQIHAYKTGLQLIPFGEKNSNTKLFNIQVSEIKKSYNLGKEIKDISIENNIKLSIIRDIIYENSWKSVLPKIIKRDGRKVRTKSSVNKNLLSRHNNNFKNSNIIIDSIDLKGNIITYSSINNASKSTNIPRKTIEYALRKNKTTCGFRWVINNTKKLEEIL